jgi:hypothetical protein
MQNKSRMDSLLFEEYGVIVRFRASEPPLRPLVATRTENVGPVRAVVRLFAQVLPWRVATITLGAILTFAWTGVLIWLLYLLWVIAT